MKRIVYILSLLMLCTSLQAQKYLRYIMKDGSFNGFYSESIDSILHRVEDGSNKSFVYGYGRQFSIPVNDVNEIKIENIIPSIDNLGDYRLYEFNYDDKQVKKLFVDNRSTLFGSASGEFNANDTIVFSSAYNGIYALIITDFEGRIKKMFLNDILLWFDYESDNTINAVVQTSDGYTVIPIEIETKVNIQRRSSKASAISNIVNFFKTNKTITGFFRTPRGKLPKDVERTISNAIDLQTKMALILAEVDSNPELRNLCTFLDVLYIGRDLAGIIAAFAAEPVTGGASTSAIYLLYIDIFSNIISLLDHTFPSEKQMEVYRDYYKKKYGINIVSLPATEITCTSAVINGSITSLKGLKGNLYFSVEPVSKTLIANTNPVSDGLWKLNATISNLEPGNTYSYIPNYRCVIDGLELVYSGANQSFATLIPVAITGTASNETKNSTTISCSYKNVPEDGVCGVEYTWNNGSIKKSIGRSNGTQTISLSGLKPGTTYTYCAFIEAYGQTYYGDSKTFTTEPFNCTVTLSDFKVTKSRYKEGEFENDGIKYDYRFDVSVTATLDAEDMSYVAEWGYVYEAPNGHKAEISLSQFGTKYTDTRYAYFRNTAHSTTRLYGYAYIVGSDNPIYGEVYDYPLDYNIPTATTGDCSNVTINSATISCSYENVPDGATCGVEYAWNEGSHMQTASSSNGIQTITLSGLKPGTTYTYCAYIEANGQTYYGEDKTFTTIAELPDITGVWHCKEYQEGSLTGEGTFKLNTDGTVTRSDLRNSGSELGSQTGRWAINANGLVHIYFEYITNSGASEKSYSGTINSIVNPTQIEGNATYRYTGNMGGGTVRTYDFVMTR